MRFLKLITLFLAAPTMLQASPAAEVLYGEHCATCHSSSLRGSAHGAALAGKSFVDKWRDQDAQALLNLSVSSMPPGESHSLSQQQHISLIQYIIEHNASSLGDTNLLASAAALKASKGDAEPEAVEFSGADAVMDMARNAGQFEPRTVKDFRPVTTADINTPPHEDWLNWRRTPDGHGHSPLQRINRSNAQ